MMDAAALLLSLASDVSGDARLLVKLAQFAHNIGLPETAERILEASYVVFDQAEEKYSPATCPLAAG